MEISRPKYLSLYFTCRSLDKGFHTENALTHVFETAELVNVPSQVEKVTVRFGTHVVLCSPYIYMKLKQIR